MVGRVAVCVVLAVGWAKPANAYNEFQKEFLKTYAGRDTDKGFRRLAKKAKCYACHQGKEDRTNYNPYGLALCEHLTEDDKKDKAKIVAALRAVEPERFDPSDDASRTFGEMLAAYELPGGLLEDCKVEPPPKDKTDSEESSTESDSSSSED